MKLFTSCIPVSVNIITLLLCVLLKHAHVVRSFTIQNPAHIHKASSIKNIPRPNHLILNATPKYTMPSQEEAVELGIREWPQQTKSSSWTDEAQEGQTLVRYILQGSGTLIVNGGDSKKFATGMLMEVEGPVSLEWKKDDGEDCIILTPGFENGGLFVGAFLGFMAMVAALVALS